MLDPLSRDGVRFYTPNDLYDTSYIYSQQNQTM